MAQEHCKLCLCKRTTDEGDYSRKDMMTGHNYWRQDIGWMEGAELATVKRLHRLAVHSMQQPEITGQLQH